MRAACADESSGKQLIAILKESGKMTDIICSVTFSFLVDIMQSTQLDLFK